MFPSDPCVPWQGSIDKDGYGTAWYTAADGRRRKTRAHRLVMDAPSALVVDHLCHNEAAARGECEGGLACPHRRCVNRSHLAIVTRKQNTEASPLTLQHRKFDTHCSRGHEFTPENTRLTAYAWGTARACRKCIALSRRRCRERVAA